MENFLLPAILVLMVVFFFWQSRKQKKQQAELDEIRNSLKKGDEVTTQSGLVGKIERVDDDHIVIKSEDGSLTKWVKGAIQVQAPVSGSQSKAKVESNKDELKEKVQIEGKVEVDGEPADAKTNTKKTKSS